MSNWKQQRPFGEKEPRIGTSVRFEKGSARIGGQNTRARASIHRNSLRSFSWSVRGRRSSERGRSTSFVQAWMEMHRALRNFWD